MISILLTTSRSRSGTSLGSTSTFLGSEWSHESSLPDDAVLRSCCITRWLVEMKVFMADMGESRGNSSLLASALSTVATSLSARSSVGSGAMSVRPKRCGSTMAGARKRWIRRPATTPSPELGKRASESVRSCMKMAVMLLPRPAETFWRISSRRHPQKKTRSLTLLWRLSCSVMSVGSISIVHPDALFLSTSSLRRKMTARRESSRNWLPTLARCIRRMRSDMLLRRNMVGASRVLATSISTHALMITSVRADRSMRRSTAASSLSPAASSAITSNIAERR
mmetsp:Transcript_17903/g.43241  ORF Transcript_17903/g.43241 Transcript_17903/m.43241 type:complete len:282 (+) Transcript_17903:318-1163(+)